MIKVQKYTIHNQQLIKKVVRNKDGDLIGADV